MSMEEIYRATKAQDRVVVGGHDGLSTPSHVLCPLCRLGKLVEYHAGPGGAINLMSS